MYGATHNFKLVSILSEIGFRVLFLLFLFVAYLSRFGASLEECPRNIAKQRGATLPSTGSEAGALTP